MNLIKKVNERILEAVSQNYMAINVVMLSLAIYIVCFPIISIPIKKLIPSFGICPYLQMTGKPCPLCGGTRYFENIFEIFHDIRYLWNPFGIIAIIILFEIIFRLKNIIGLKKGKKYIKTIKIDMQITAGIIIAFFLYEILYFIV